MIVSFSVLCKAAGSAAVAGSVLAWILWQRRADAERLRRLDSLIAFVYFAREQVDRYLSPVSEILRRCDAAILDGCRIGCPERAGEIRDLAHLNELLSTGTYASDGQAAIGEFAAAFGRSYREEELRSCDVCAEELSRLRATLAETLPGKRRSRAVLGSCAAAAIIILLL